MATTIEITHDELIVRVQGADRLWALRSRLEIPVEHVAGAGPASEEARRWLHGLRVGGAHIPGVLSAGRFYSHGQLVFWDVHDPEKAISVWLRDEHYARLILEVEDPDQEISRIQQAAAAVPA